MGAHRRRAGLTLAELTVSIVVLALVSGILMSLLIQALKMYNQGLAETSANDRASTALALMLPDVREAVNVDYPGPQQIDFTLPQKDANGYNYVNPSTRSLQAGLQVRYYLSDGTGATPSTAGTYLWRAKRNIGETTWTPERILTSEVDHLLFTYAPTTDLLELVQCEITVRASASPGSFARTVVGEICLRNH